MCLVLKMSQKLLIISLFVPEADTECYSNRHLEFIYAADLTFSLSAASTKKLTFVKTAPSIKTPLAARMFFIIPESGHF